MALTQDERDKLEKIRDALHNVFQGSPNSQRQRRDELIREVNALLAAASPAAAPDSAVPVAGAPPAHESAGEPDSAPGETSIAEFFGDVGRGLVDAQSELDRLSARYIEDSRARRHVQPSVFRVPKVTGSLKVGLTRTKGSRMGLLLFSTRQEAERHQEHEISFEMVSAPPPIEALEEITRLPGTFHPVLAPGSRQAVRAALLPCLSGDESAGRVEDGIVATGRQHGRIVFGEGLDHVLLYGGAAGDYFLVARYGEVPRLPARLTASQAEVSLRLATDGRLAFDFERNSFQLRMALEARPRGRSLATLVTLGIPDFLVSGEVLESIMAVLRTGRAWEELRDGVGGRLGDDSLARLLDDTGTRRLAFRIERKQRRTGTRRDTDIVALRGAVGQREALLIVRLKLEVHPGDGSPRFEALGVDLIHFGFVDGQDAAGVDGRLDGDTVDYFFRLARSLGSWVRTLT